MGLKDVIGNRDLKGAMVGRIRNIEFTNINRIKSIGILFEDEPEMYTVANRIIKTFQARRISTRALGYRNIKGIDLEMTTSFDIKFFTKTDLNWYGKPGGNEVEMFLSQRFDLLIDLTNGDRFAFKYIMTLSSAKCKIGGVAYKDNPYDVIIVKNNENSEQFINTIIDFFSGVK